MCGIVGFTNYHSDINREQIVKAMADVIQHRGPDDEGFYIDQYISLGHRRLSIIDIDGGHQPMFNEDKSIAIVFNGEIYNFQELKLQLEQKGHRFNSNSDTEVIVHLYEEYQEDLLPKLNGMFAFALWDKRTETLLLARDRAGKKPLYYSEVKGEFVFASELKSILQYPYYRKDINHTALYKYLAHEYVPTPHTIFTGIKKIPAGSYLLYKKGASLIKPYWDYRLADSYTNKASESEIIETLDQLMTKAVKRRLISDVPLGVFLSGGIDSSTLVSYMADLIPSRDIKTFSIGFKDKSFDESQFARDVAIHFDTHHHEEILEPKALIDIIPKVIDFIDEPFADASIIPTYLLSQFTREHVTVALGGDGGDELFMGYPTFQANKLARFYDWIPKSIHHNVVEKLAQNLPVSMNNISLDFKIKQFLHGVKADKRYREMIWLGAFNYQNLGDLITSQEIERLKEEELYSESLTHYGNSDGKSLLDRTSYLYFKTYLHDDILVKVDRATMAASLEARAPFLDAELMDFIGTIPHKYKINGLNMKYILKKLLATKLPQHIIDRPKKGFGIPVAKWFRDDLKDYVLDVFSEDKIKREGIFQYSHIKNLLDDHFEGKRDNRKKLWTLFMFEQWLEKWGK